MPAKLPTSHLTPSDDNIDTMPLSGKSTLPTHEPMIMNNSASSRRMVAMETIFLLFIRDKVIDVYDMQFKSLCHQTRSIDA